MAAEETTSANEYILHHLTFLSNKEPKGIVDFSVIHWDTVFFSVALALLFGGSFYLAARTAKAGRGSFRTAFPTACSAAPAFACSIICSPPPWSAKEPACRA